MSLGFSMTKADLDNVLGRELGAAADSLAELHKRNLWLQDASHNQAFMVALGYSTTEDGQMRAAVGDLDSLWQISHGTGSKGIATIGSSAAANDFWFTAKLLGGVNWWGTT